MGEESGRLSEGQLIDERWEVQHLLGVGELAEVYDVHDRKTSGSAVLKLFAAQFLDAPNAWLSYQTRAERVRALGLPAVVNPFSFGIHKDSRSPFSVAERATVPALDQLVATVGTLLPAQFARILRELGPLLDTAHQAGIVHRNLKPSNVFCGIQDPKSLRIGDFAVSALRRELAPYPGWGATPGWLAPEAVDPKATDDLRSDVYTVGLLAFFALTDRSPFLSLGSFEPAAFLAELNAPLPPLSERARALGAKLDPKLDAWFGRALATAPDARFASVGEMTDELLDLTDQPRASALSHETGTRQLAGETAGPLSLSASIRAPTLSADPGVASASVQPLVFNDSLSKPRHSAQRGADPHSIAQEIPRTLPPPPIQARQRDNQRVVLLAAAATGVVALVSAGVVAGVLLSERSEQVPTPQASQMPQNTQPAPDTAAAPAAEPAAEAAAALASSSAKPLKAPPTTGNVSFDCTPVPCGSIHCDGNKLGDPLANAELSAGEHRCVGSAEGYLPAVTTFKVEAGQELIHPLELKPEARPKAAPPKRSTVKKRSTSKTKASKTAKPCGTFINPCK